MLTLKIDSQAHLTGHLPGAVADRIKARLTFTNPAHQEAEKRGFYTGNIPRDIRGWRQEAERLTVPRGFTAQLVGILRDAAIQYRIEDKRRTLAPVAFTFHGQLEDFQETAATVMAARDFGTLAAPTGSGKTVIAMELIARRRQPALIVVHTRELKDQWIARIGTFLSIPPQEVGLIGGGKINVGEQITVALVQTLCKCAPEIAPHIGFLIVDEAHRCPSRIFTKAVTAFDCRFMLGLSATPWRRDGLSRLIYWHLGDKVHEVDKAALVEAGYVLQADVVWRETSFEPTFDPSAEYSKMLSELTQDPERNGLIATDVAQEAQGDAPGGCLVLSDRKAHCEALGAALAARGVEAAILLPGTCPR